MNFAARAWLFDFDGTLVDSGPLHDWAFRHVLATAAPEILAGFDYESIKGLTTRGSFVSLGIDDGPTLAWCVAAKQRLYREALRAGRLHAYPGARQMLEMVRAHHAESYVVSSGSADSVRLGLDSCDLRKFFAGIITAEDAPAGKPAPAPYLACLCRFGLEAESAIAIEDAAAGVRSAHAAGLPVIGVHNAAIAAAADRYFPDFAAMSAALDGVGDTIGFA